MRKLYAVIAFAALLWSCGPAKMLVTADKTPIKTSIDLINVTDDKVQVTVDPGTFTTDQVVFHIPRTVPGTYTSDNYGQYVEGLKALDYKGNELSVSKSDQNTWNISNGKELDKVVYWVNDTFDTETEVPHAVFSPAGTNINAGEEFMLNLHGFVGYFKGFREVPYQLTINHPQKLEASTSLTKVGGDKQDPTVDTFYASRYFEITDNPIEYSKPNKVSFQLNDITVTLDVYSPNHIYTAEALKDKMETMMRAQKAFLGDVNSTKIYNILLYLSTLENNDATGFGALEHHTSTVVVLPEAMPLDRMEQSMVDVVSHEFFHTLTPLNVHSKEIQFFDYNDPKMSEHLWMYEGTTEYFANLFQIQQGLIDEDEFYKRMMQKEENAKSYDDTMSFTTMSRHILEEAYKDSYANVYEKGALINMCLDIMIRDLSNGEKGVLWMMKELSKKYDNDTPFNDEDLFDEIEALTYPEVRQFLDTYVAGTTPINYADFWARVGLHSDTVEVPTGYFLNGEIPFIDIDEDNGNAIFVRKGIKLNSFFNSLGLQGGDVIEQINGTDISLETIRPILGQSLSWTPDTEITIKVKRGDEELELKGKVGQPTLQIQKMVPMENATERQEMLRNKWLHG